jgi:hypothetical protein
MKRILLVMMLLLPLYGEAWATVYPATSGTQAHVQDAINLCSNGDTVTIPADDETWTGRITVAKEIAIIGDGIDSTIIRSYGFVVSDGTDDWRISGITFSGAGAELPIDAGGTKSTTGVNGWRIDHCKFIGYAHHIEMNGDSTGVIDNCIFQGATNAYIDVFGEDETAWTKDDDFGTDKFVIIEDNTFETAGVNGSHFILSNFGGRMVIRYNDFIETAGSYESGWIDTHGYCHGTNARGSRIFEIYSNTFTRSGENTCCRGLFLRGGTGLVYDNVFDESAAEFIHSGNHATIQMVDYRASEWAGTSDVCNSTCNTAKWCKDGETYPCCDQIGRGKDQASSPSYFWNNVDDADDPAVILVDSGSSAYIQLNRDYFTTEYSYTPYTYPHPLRGEGNKPGCIQTLFRKVL